LKVYITFIPSISSKRKIIKIEITVKIRKVKFGIVSGMPMYLYFKTVINGIKNYNNMTEIK